MGVLYRPAVVDKRLQVLGKLIGAARRTKGITQQELATRIGVSRMTAYRLEQGDPRIAWATVFTACWLLGIPSDPDVLTDREYTELMTRGEYVRRAVPRELDDNF